MPYSEKTKHREEYSHIGGSTRVCAGYRNLREKSCMEESCSLHKGTAASLIDLPKGII